MLAAALSGYTGAAQRRADLIQRSLASLEAGRLHEAYLLADISCQATSVAPDDLLLRAAIAARLGCPALEMAGVEAAWDAEPSMPSTQLGMLAALARRGDHERADGVARAILRLGASANVIGPAIAALKLSAGCEGVALCRVSPAGLRITVFSQDERAFEIGLDFGHRRESLPIETRRAQAPAGFPGAAGHAELAWRDEARLALLRSEPPLDCPGPPPIRPYFEPGRVPVAARHPPPVVPVTVIMPVHGECRTVRAAIEAVLVARGGTPQQLVLVNDRPEAPELASLLAGYAGRQGVAIIANPANLGFVASVNAALVTCPAGDVVLLNDDTLVPPGWLERMSRAAHLDTGIGTVTPLSNNGELTSVPAPFGAVPMPDAQLVAAIDRLASEIAPQVKVELPNGVGFCLYITRACREATGLLDDANYRDGYLEEVDYCLRAMEHGFSHLCALDVFVGHVGGTSFRTRRGSLVAHNKAKLARVFPEAGPRTSRFVRADPLRGARIALQNRLLQAGLPLGGTATLVIGRGAIPPDGAADLPGVAGLGSERSLLRLCFAGSRPVLHRDGAMAPCRLPFDPGEDEPAAALAQLLGGQEVREIVYLDARHPRWARDLPGRLGVTYAVRAMDDSVVTVAQEDRGWSHFLAGATRFVSASSQLAARAVASGLRQPEREPLRLARGSHAPTSGGDGPCSVAVFMETADTRTWLWVQELSRMLVQKRSPLRLTVFGPTRDDDRLRSTGAVIVTGMPSPDLAAESFALHRCVATFALLPADCIEHPALTVIAQAPRPLLSWNPYLPAVIGCAAGDSIVMAPDLSGSVAVRHVETWPGPLHG
jgi:GT2 family glycosyltransferase